MVLTGANGLLGSKGSRNAEGKCAKVVVLSGISNMKRLHFVLYGFNQLSLKALGRLSLRRLVPPCPVFQPASRHSLSSGHPCHQSQTVMIIFPFFSLSLFFFLAPQRYLSINPNVEISQLCWPEILARRGHTEVKGKAADVRVIKTQHSWKIGFVCLEMNVSSA